MYYYYYYYYYILTTQPYTSLQHVLAPKNNIHYLCTHPFRTALRQSRTHVPMGPYGDSVFSVGAVVIQAPGD